MIVLVLRDYNYVAYTRPLCLRLEPTYTMTSDEMFGDNGEERNIFTLQSSHTYPKYDELDFKIVMHFCV